MTRAASVLLAVLTLLFLSFVTGCGSSSPPPPAIAVSVTNGGASSVPAGASTGLVGTVTNDTSMKGVTWKATCNASQCGSVAPGSSLSGQNVNYSAPTAPPANDLTVTVTATSVASPSASNSVKITVPAVTVAATPATADVQAGLTLPISASVNNDIFSKGVSWSISPSGVGSLTSPSPFGVTYTAPATPPASDATLQITATSLFDPSKSFVVNITVPFATLTVTPSTASTAAATSVSNISATVGNDPSNKGVNWSASCTTAPCGTFSANTSASGAPITYNAPPNAPAADMPVTLTATSVADPTASASLTVTILAISVTVTTPASNVQFGDSVANIVATVANDPAGKGVTWSVQQPCSLTQCGTVSAQTTPSGGAVSYTAPNTPPPGNTTINVVATSISDTTKSNAVGITILAITISVSPTSGFIPVGAISALNATTFTATVGNDTSNQGVTWSLSQGNPPPTPCTAACGTLTPSGTTASFAAPTSIPTNASVNVTATSVADTTKIFTVAITLTNGTVKIIPASLNFGTVKKTPTTHPSRTLSLQLTNTGGSDLGITGQTTSAPYSVTVPCPATVASGISCAISVRFAPTVLGTFDSDLTITDNDTTSPQQVPLSGRACNGIRCTAAAIQHAIVTDRLLTTPAPVGSNRVGTRTLSFVDPDRADPYLDSGQKRELLVRFWYPAAFTRNCAPAQYASPAAWNYLSRLVQVSPPEVKTNSCQDAPITGGTHPVVVFTHGYTGMFTDYTFLFEDLASRGYVVASVAHTYESTAVQFPDGRLLTSRMGSHLAKNLQMDEPSTTLAVVVRLGDLKFVMDELERINHREKSPFFSALDLSRVALAGHSLGGLTALLGLEMEPRFRAAVSLDGAAPSSWFAPTTKPVMMLVAGSDLWSEDNCHVWTQLHGPRLAVDLKNSEHITPSDAIWLTDGAIQTSGGMDRTVAAVRDYVAAFLDAQLNGKAENRLLSGPSADYPDVSITTQNQNQCTAANTSLSH